jgi:hypothetical protein
MAATVLVGTDVERGADVLRALDREGLKVQGAYWLRDPSTMQYRFTIVLPNSAGPRADVRLVREALDRQQIDFPIWEINVVSADDETASLIRRAVKTDPAAVANIHFAANVINNTFIEDALIYRSA